MDEKQVEKSLYTSLKELDLTDQEINLYSVSLQLGPSPIATLARRIGISRPNVYKVIKSLEKHGLASFTQKTRFSRDFLVEPPTIILEKIRQKKEKLSRLDNDFVNSLPTMLAGYHQGAGTTRIKILQGREQYMEEYDKILEEAQKETLYCGSAEDFINFISWEVERKWIKRRIQKNIFIKTLLLPSATSKDFKSKDETELRETRFLTEANPFSTSFQIFGNKVIIWQPQAPLAVLIEDQYIVAMLSSLFQVLWQKSETKLDEKLN